MSATELHKSSAEILSELFNSFNVEPPNLEEKLLKKHKKSKKKHKRKEKKHKKKSKYKYSSSSSDQSSSEKDGNRKHKSKKRCKAYDSDSSNSNVLNGFGYDFQNVKIKLEHELEAPVVVKTEKALSEPSNSENNESSSVSLLEKDTFTNQNERSEEPRNMDMCQEKKLDKCDGKISIKNLKNSSVYEAAIKEAKEKAQEKAARFEEGELTKSENEDDDIDNIISSELVKKHSESNRHSRKRKYSDGERRSKHYDLKRSRKDKQKSHRSRSRDRNVSSGTREHESSYYYRSSHSYYESSGSSRYRYKDGKKRSRSKERSHSRSSKDRSSLRMDRKRRSRSPSSSIDKKKLLEIARKNAINMLKSGTLPEALTLGPQAQEKVIAAIKAGGKTIEELTDFCKNLSKKEELGELSSVSSNEDDVESTSDNEKVFHHPFQIKDKPTSIVMNIKNATPLPLKTAKEKSAELRIQFPVSSGQLHRKTENEWVPVSPKKIETALDPAPVAVVLPVQKIQPSVTSVTVEPAPYTVIAPTPPTQTEMDISSIVSQRLSLMRKLQENPNDVQALNQMYRVQQEMQTWAQSKQQPGQFTGSTGAQILSAAELSSGYQAWARKDQLQNAAPVTGGMGMHLLQKMGWKPGEGLGKEKTGSLEPLLLEVKLDKKGLVANEEVKFKKPTKLQKAANTVKTLAGKHPVSLLGEFATKRKLGVPQYECCFECGPDHKKNFLFKVILNGIEYKPNVASSTKKQAKADAATLCLQQLGLLAS